MTGSNRFEGHGGVVIHGKAYSLTQILGVKVKCYLVLKKSAFPPHTLEKYENSKSQKANLILLKNVIINPSGKHGFEIISKGKVVHHFTFDSDPLTSDWIKHLKELSSFESDIPNSNGEASRFAVSVLPSVSLRLSGPCLLEVSALDISVCQGSSRTSWPLKWIRSYGIDRNKFTIATGHATVTGRAEFIFEVLKPCRPYNIYHEVAARISSIRPTTIIEPGNDTRPSCLREVQYADMKHDDYSSPADLDRHIYEDSLPPSSCSLHSSSTGSQPGVVDSEEPREMYFEVPHNLGMTLQLPCRSFGSILGLEKCVEQLESLLVRRRHCSSSVMLMLYGAPHSGKWTLANALATKLQARVFSLQCRTLTTALNGDALGTLRETLDRILTLKQCVFFLDEIDVLPKGFRDSDTGRGVLRAITEFLDRVSSGSELVVVCSTAFPWDVDESLQRRLVHRVYVPLSPASVRLQIVRSSCEKTPLGKSETVLETISERTSGFTRSDLIALCGELESTDRFRRQSLRTGAADGYEHLEEILEKRWKAFTNHDSDHQKIASSATYYTAQTGSEGIFFVKLENKTTLPYVSSCFLIVTPSGLDLCDLEPSHVIVSWPSKEIRGFGSTRNTFSLEIGSSSATESGFFTFLTSEGARIQHLIQTRCAKRTAENGPSP